MYTDKPMLHYLFILGISVEAITGAIAAGRKKMDFFGVLLIASITALGGGTVRDTLFNLHPLTWVANPEYLLITASFGVMTILLAPSIVRVMKLFLILDALGLATFAIIGAQKVLASGMPLSAAIIGGTITGVCGGMLRDILCNDIPLVLRKELYAVIAIAGASLYVFLMKMGVSQSINVFISISAIFLIRLWAILYHIEMPKFNYTSDLRKSHRKRRK